jgi:glycosyltransferase involved in cell wall biosynthesis
MEQDQRQPRLLILVLTFNAERTCRKVLSRIPNCLARFDVEILLIDDASRDDTFDTVVEYQRAGHSPFPLTVLANPVNQGYGGNQKIGYFYAIEMGFDFVALLHGDGQYPPEKLPEMIDALLQEDADAVFGSRFMERLALLRGGMPLYKFLGNRVLSTFQNLLLGQHLSEFHSGYRIYRVAALKSIPYGLNTQDFHFDTEIIIQLIRARKRIHEHPIPTYYGDEICHVNGLSYAWNVARVTMLARLMDLGILYQRRFDVDGRPPYEGKTNFDSSHSEALSRVPGHARVLDIGCGTGIVGRALRDKGCFVTGIDSDFPGAGEGLDAFLAHDLSSGSLPITLDDFSHILLLDVVEHMADPEEFVSRLKRACNAKGAQELIVTTGNVAFIVVRLMLALGAFNYGKRGILDLTHKRLFTFRTIRRLFEESGFAVEEVQGIPAPFPLALGDGRAARGLLRLNRLLIRISRSLFSFQILLRVRPLPSLPSLLESAIYESRVRSETRVNGVSSDRAQRSR